MWVGVVLRGSVTWVMFSSFSVLASFFRVVGLFHAGPRVSQTRVRFSRLILVKNW